MGYVYRFFDWRCNRWSIIFLIPGSSGIFNRRDYRFFNDYDRYGIAKRMGRQKLFVWSNFSNFIFSRSSVRPGDPVRAAAPVLDLPGQTEIEFRRVFVGLHLLGVIIVDPPVGPADHRVEPCVGIIGMAHQIGRAHV